ncbi:MAG: hypothetical protein U0L72_07995 [Acutalibacteraceae bacterium]|nr:hypothetical protein [Acutalibacteraceae bacterium]
MPAIQRVQVFICVNLQACANIIRGAVAEGNALIEEIIERDK